jgi:hypothetical protein
MFATWDVSSLTSKPRKDGSGWYVEVTWNDGRVQQVGTFGSETAARDWIEWDAPKFFRSDPGSSRESDEALQV